MRFERGENLDLNLITMIGDAVNPPLLLMLKQTFHTLEKTIYCHIKHV